MSGMMVGTRGTLGGVGELNKILALQELAVSVTHRYKTKKKYKPNNYFWQ